MGLKRSRVVVVLRDLLLWPLPASAWWSSWPVVCGASCVVVAPTFFTAFHSLPSPRASHLVHRPAAGVERSSSAVKRFVNFSFALRSADSGSMPSLRARLAIANSRSPISSSFALAPSHVDRAGAAPRPPLRSCRRHPRRAASRSRPRRRALPISWARSSEGRVAGTPASSDRARSGVGLLLRLDLLPLLEHLARRVERPAVGIEDVRMPPDQLRA